MDFNKMNSQNSRNSACVSYDITRNVPKMSSKNCVWQRHQQPLKIRSKERVVTKAGYYNLEKVKKSKVHVFPDIVTAYVEARWRWTLVYCVLTYVTIWLFFTGIWWSIMYRHGDLEIENLPDALNNTEWKPCIREIYGFTSIFLFSIEVHTTVGYGNRALTMECPAAMFTMCIESILGTMVQSFIVGILFAKLTVSKNRAQTIIFSKNAIINQRDRQLCLIFRVGNTRKSRIIAIHVQAFLIRCVLDGADTSIDEQTELKLTADGSEDFSFMFPISVVHKIDEKSPFYTISACDLLKSDLEILVVFEGIIESTGQTVQAKSSYITNEILWGHRFLSVVKYKKNKQGYIVDYSKFDETLRVNTPLCAGNRIKNFYNNIPRIRMSRI